jgi:hypothetical protein
MGIFSCKKVGIYLAMSWKLLYYYNEAYSQEARKNIQKWGFNALYISGLQNIKKIAFFG